MKQNLRKRRAPLTEKISVRLPGALLGRVDALAVYSMSPRAIVLRRLVARGLEKEEAAL